MLLTTIKMIKDNHKDSTKNEKINQNNKKRNKNTSNKKIIFI